MADARVKSVLSALADLYSRSNYAVDLMTQLREPMGRGDIVEVPSISSLTVTSDGSTGASPQAISASVLSCQANLHPAIFAQLKAIDQMQLLSGAWGQQVGMQALMMLKNSIDQSLCRDYLAQSLAYDTSATYHDNVAGDSATLDDVVSVIAKLLNNDGCQLENIIGIFSPFGIASLQSIAEFTYQIQDPNTNALGIRKVGNVFGMDCYVSNSIANGRTVAASASAIASNVLTCTVASGHGVVPGMKITTSGGDANITTAAAVTSVTATTIVAPLTSGDDAANQALTITVESSENLIIDKAHVFVSQQLLPTARIVADYDSTDDALQVSAIWGRIGRAGRVRVLHTPKSSA